MLLISTIMNLLYYGDNLDILRRYVKDESVDLVYLDPPFKSDQNYNVLFAERSGARSAAQIKAFEDTWTWDQVAAAAFEEVVKRGGRVVGLPRVLERKRHARLPGHDGAAFDRIATGLEAVRNEKLNFTEFVIDEPEAEIVRRIYGLYADGKRVQADHQHPAQGSRARSWPEGLE